MDALRASEIRLVRLGNRLQIIVEKILRIFRASLFRQRTQMRAAIDLDSRPDHVEGARVLYRHRGLKRLAPLDEPETLHDVELIGVRRTVIVDKRLVVQPDG